MPNKTIMHLICENGDPLLYTSKDLCELLSQFIHDLDREYQGNRFELLPESIEKKVSPRLHKLVCRAVQLIDKTITDGRNGVCSLSQGTTNEFLPKFLPEFKHTAMDLSKIISEDIQNVKREVAFLLSPVVNCLDKFTKLDDKIFENLLALASNSVPVINEVRDLLPDSEKVIYKFDRDKVVGMIDIAGFDQVLITERRAVMLHFLYNDRYKTNNSDYHDVNKFFGNFPGLKNLSSDCLRLDVNNINKRIDDITQGKISKIIDTIKVGTKNRTQINKYKFITN